MSFRRFFKTIQAVAMSRIRSAQRYEKAALVFPNNGVARDKVEFVRSQSEICVQRIHGFSTRKMRNSASLNKDKGVVFLLWSLCWI